ncbi:glycosyltransferase family 4 protein [Terrisporobacter mayombei]|uniref:N, N'-diacetylbacillosaminyl-diphospho-undecaprenol alpha-1,3-N-acetylgalactosaminyltransferase n=1 Tax=Terrisporobacter mayombei TaxID=1541 RepID=A0ABY9Q738_9FIRM|nr:glycosyltransferase family 4 protein [Terrisporobacter mayombei]MCC3869663.1 glycosyltransferase family 4 protein [Terrisporobacter mayombei]WMT83399.1 N,N'-diacetylbacillosaminyl-diphospho-undecaprenol alpha-1,3-N-acetylgalactosaminyltransferase [Terrisporobacter mayombei]
MGKKLLILANHFATIYKFRKELVSKLVKEGYEVVISLPFSQDIYKIKDLGVKVIDTNVDRKSVNPVKDFKLLNDYTKIIKEEKPDIVLSYTIKSNIYGGIACRLHETPFMANVTGLGSAYYREGLIKNIVSRLYKIGLKKAKGVFFENIANAQVLIDDKTINKDQAIVLKGAGVNLQQFQYCEMPSDDIVKFLFIGRIMAEKGVNELFEAIKRIKKEYSNVEFSFIGWFEEDYKNLIEDLQSEGLIKYYGYQEDVTTFIKDSHCIVLPSYHEGMANVLLEGAAMGRVIITSDIYGCREAVVEGISGCTCKVRDSVDLYKKIKMFVDMDFEEKVKMGQAGRRHMEDIFDKDKVVEETVEEMGRWVNQSEFCM